MDKLRISFWFFAIFLILLNWDNIELIPLVVLLLCFAIDVLILVLAKLESRKKPIEALGLEEKRF